MRDQIVMDSLERYVPGADYIDIGPLFGTVNETISVAAQFKPRSLSAADIDPLTSESWSALRTHLKDRGIENVREFSVSIDDPKICEKIGVYDFVYSAGILYHVPSPLYTLSQYRSLTRRYFLLGTMVVPSFIENEHGRLDFDGGMLAFVPALGIRERKILSTHFENVGLQIHHINATDSWPWRDQGRPSYGPWWWLYSAETCRRMISTSGFKVLVDESTWGGRHHYFLCEIDN
jgi:hypothetical protein